MKHIRLFPVILLLLSAAILAACKDDEGEDDGMETVRPDDMNYEPFEVTEATGSFQVNSSGDWFFLLDNTNEILGQSFGFEDEASVRITNMSDGMKEMEGQVSISGSVQFQYIRREKGNSAGIVTYCYTLQITSAKPVESESVSKSIILSTDTLICGTLATEEPSWLYERANSTNFEFKTYNFRVFIHIVRNSDGSGTQLFTNQNIINQLNSYYAGSNISFSLYGTDYIDSNQLNLMNSSDYAKKALFSSNHKDNAINIYVITDGRNLGITGTAGDIPSNSLLIKNAYSATSVIAHEMGHCLGLYHTHHGTFQQEGGTPELVNGSNSAVAGDFITDTPADPKMWNQTTGEYTGGSLSDANGDIYSPLLDNLMSYNGPRYIKNFTQKQIEHIYKSISNSSMLRSTCTTYISSISGPSYFNGSATYSVNIPNGYDVTWNVKIDSYTSKTARTTSYKTFTGSSITISADANAPAQKFAISATTKNAKGVEFQLTKTARHCAISAATGTLSWGSSTSGSSSYGKTGTLKIGGVSSSNVIKVYQGGDLYFYYNDAAGADSRTSDNFNFTLTNSTSNFTKYSGGKHAFKCSENAKVGSYTDNLVVSCGSQMNVTPVTIQILSKSATADLEDEEEEDIDETTNTTN